MNIIIVGCGNIGFETAKLLVKQNMVLLIDCYQPKHITEFLKKEKNAFFVQGDATNLSEIDTILNDKANFNKIDALICTVGAGSTSTPFENFDKFRDNFELNFFGNLVPIKAVLERMISARAGKIVVISSTSGHHSPLGLTAYAPSKWALENLCRSLREEVRTFGISVDVISPTNIKNKHSKTFHSKSGVHPNIVANKIIKIIKKSNNSNHFVPGRYRLLHLVERVIPNILDIKFGLMNKSKRVKKYKKMNPDSILITGASSGLGKELAYLYSKSINNMYLVARNYNQLLNIKDDIMSNSKCNVHIANFDISDSEAIMKYVNSISHIDLLINNAGYSVTGEVRNISINDFKQNFATNFFGAVLLTVGFLKKKHHPQKIINILSTAAIAGRRGHSSYSATNASLWTFTRSLRRNYRDDIQIIEVLPSTFKSNFHKNIVNIKSDNEIIKKEFHSNIPKKITQIKLTSKKVAEIIYKAENNGREIVLIPYKAKLFLILEASFPWLFQKLFG